MSSAKVGTEGRWPVTAQGQGLAPGKRSGVFWRRLRKEGKGAAMKRIKMIGLCVVAACGLAALAGASTASAAKFSVCVPSKHAVYANSTCTEVAMKKGVPSGKGKFEKVEAGTCVPAKHSVYEDAACSKVAMKKGVPSGKGKFEKAGGTAKVTGAHAELVSAAGTIECSSSSGTETFTGGKSLTAVTIFKGCETKGAKCQNTATAGEIATFELIGKLVEPAAGKASINLTGNGNDGKKAGLLAEFGCTGVAAVRVSGGPLGGKISPVNTWGTSSTTTFEKEVEQGLTAEFGPAGFPPAETLVLPSEQIGAVTAVTALPVNVEAP
jgi:hypothetical protein